MMRIHVVHENRAWHVRAEGLSPRRIDTLYSRERAVEHALQLADRLRRYEDSIVVQVEGETLVTVRH